jgi:demethylmenaquinone methyltransferase/2-methoxy-6-polyprenyl-1,4-benzoquinol methylase
MDPAPRQSLDPVPAAPAETRAWYDRASGLYARFVAGLEYPPTAAAIEALDLEGTERVADLGCGPGHAVVDVASRLDAGSVVGVDFARGMCREAAAAIDEAGVGDQAAVVCGDVTALPLRTDSVDIALSSFVIDLLGRSDIDAALTEIRRVLGHDGRVAIVSLAASAALPTRAYRLLRKLFPAQLDCRPLPLPSVLETHGFAIEAVQEHSLYGLPVAVAIATP